MSDLARQLDIHPNYISQVINSVEQKNFYDFINEHRVEEFKQLVSLPENQHFTLLALAFECGFNSKTSFNRNFKKAFADHGYRVVFYDQRGSGLSERFPNEAYSIQIMLDDLKAVIQHYQTSPTQQVFLLGHSWGAILAAAYIDTYPDAIDGVVLAEPGGLIWEDIADYVKRSRSVVITKELANDLLYSDQFITGKEDQHAILDYKYALLGAADGHPDNPTGDEGPVPFWRSGAVVNQALFEVGNDTKPDWTTHLDRFTTQVLFIYSENNRAYGLAHAQKVSAPWPNVELFETPDAGHAMLSFPTGWNHTFPKMLQYFNHIKH